MVSLAQIDLKLQNSFDNIKKDMDSFRDLLQKHSKKISVMEDKIDAMDFSDDIKELRKDLDKKDNSLSFKDDIKNVRKELENIEKKNMKEFALLREKLQNLRDDAVFEEDLEKIKDELLSKNIPEKPKEKPKKEENPKKKMFDKVIDFFAEED